MAQVREWPSRHGFRLSGDHLEDRASGSGSGELVRVRARDRSDPAVLSRYTRTELETIHRFLVQGEELQDQQAERIRGQRVK